MSIITENRRNFRPVRTTCLTKLDNKSLGQLSKEMLQAKSDDEVLKIARQILNANRRNCTAMGNEGNINIIMDYVKSNTSKGDYISFNSIDNEIYSRGDLYYSLDHFYAVANAIPVVLTRLEKEGYLKKKKVARTDVSGRNGATLYTHIYEVIC